MRSLPCILRWIILEQIAVGTVPITSANVGFGAAGIYISLGQTHTDCAMFAPGAIDPHTDVFTWSLSSASPDFAFAEGWRTDIHARQLADLNGDGKAELVVSGDLMTQVLSPHAA